MNFLRPQKRVLILALICILASFCTAFAEGDGEGGGANSGEAIVIESSSVQNGQTGVSLNPQINLNFNKNVINASVASNNAGCFSLVDENGKGENISIIMGDDQIDPGAKRLITIAATGLQPGTRYNLQISGALTAKNGASMGSPVSISFTTEGVKAAEKPAAAAVNPEKSILPEENKTGNKTTKSSLEAAKTEERVTSNGVSTTDEALPSLKATDKNKEAGSKKAKTDTVPVESHTNTIMVFAGIAIVLIILAAVYVIYRKMRKA